MFSYQSCSAYKKMQNSGLHLGDYHSDVTKQHQKFNMFVFSRTHSTVFEIRVQLVLQAHAVIHIKGFPNSMTKCAGNSCKFGLTWLPLVLKEIILNTVAFHSVFTLMVYEVCFLHFILMFTVRSL